MTQCPRCNGFLVNEYFLTPLSESRRGFEGRRCLNCGAILDEVIRANQMLSLSTAVPRYAGSP